MVQNEKHILKFCRRWIVCTNWNYSEGTLFFQDCSSNTHFAGFHYKADGVLMNSGTTSWCSHCGYVASYHLCHVKFIRCLGACGCN